VVKYYAVWAAPRSEGRLGVHHCSWEEVRRRLRIPPAGLAATGVHLKGFTRFREAAAYWSAQTGREPDDHFFHLSYFDELW
jgi:aminoglycoside phosphotransferase (APT) family kinase protein